MHVVLALLCAAVAAAMATPEADCTTALNNFQGKLKGVMAATNEQELDHAAGDFANLFAPQGSFFDPLFTKANTGPQQIKAHVKTWYKAHAGCTMTSSWEVAEEQSVASLGYKYNASDPANPWQADGTTYCGIPLTVTLTLTAAAPAKPAKCSVDSKEINRFEINKGGFFNEAYMLYNFEKIIPELTQCTENTCTKMY